MFWKFKYHTVETVRGHIIFPHTGHEHQHIYVLKENGFGRRKAHFQGDPAYRSNHSEYIRHEVGGWIKGSTIKIDTDANRDVDSSLGVHFLR